VAVRQGAAVRGFSACLNHSHIILLGPKPCPVLYVEMKFHASSSQVLPSYNISHVRCGLRSPYAERC
jgi:hypothetical protein